MGFFRLFHPQAHWNLVALAAVCITLPRLVHAQNADETGPDLPEPPMQQKAWTPPPTKLPPVVVSAVTELFKQGLADPRGCEYREIEINEPGGSGDSSQPNLKVHGWVLPGDGKTHYAVGWNGRVIPVASVGPPADVEKDITPAIIEQKPPYGGIFPFGGGVGLSDTGYEIINFNQKNARKYEHGSLSEKSVAPLKIALLLRLGKAPLAEIVWKAFDEKGDPYPQMAAGWLLSWYHYGDAARVAGNDRLALQVFKALLPLQKAVTSTATLRGYTGHPYLQEIKDLSTLIADEESRIKEPPHDKGIPADTAARVAACIHDLEMVETGPMMTHSDTDVSQTRQVWALEHEGDAAVEPLIHCIESDMRLTRSKYFYPREFSGSWIPVYEPAYIALVHILKTSIAIPLPAGKNVRNLTMEERKALADKFRAFWATRKDLPQEERWFAALRDDHESPVNWLQAAAMISGRPDAPSSTNMFSQTTFGRGFSADELKKLHREPLREKSNPSVSDLLVQRFRSVLPGSKRDAGNLLCDLAAWDGKARGDDLRKLTREFNEKYPVLADRDTTGITTSIYDNRFESGDPGALEDYAEWLAALTPDNLPVFEEAKPFRLMWEHPDDPAILKAAEKMFAAKESPWQPVNQHGSAHLLNTPMIAIPAFRELALKGLSDTRVIGYARHDENSAYEDHEDIYLLDRHYENPVEKPSPDKLGTPFRLCDLYACRLGKTVVFPECRLSWPLSKRDAAVTACKPLLRQYGAAFRFGPQNGLYIPGNGDTSMQPAFPQLDHPATAREVSEGRAIFSLSGSTRAVPLPRFPITADRPSSRQDVSEYWQTLPDGKRKKELNFTTKGMVWQAEEVLVHGKWERYYGFIGRHQLEKVPAAEIEFSSSFGLWKNITPFFDGAFDFLDRDHVKIVQFNGYTISGTASPLPFVFKIQNHNGLDREVPGALLIPPNATKTLPQGVSLTVTYSPNMPVQYQQPGTGMSLGLEKFDYGKWENVPLRPEITIAPAQAHGQLLNAACELTLLQLDLRDYFDLTRPGMYRVQAIFQPPGQPAVKTGEFTLALVEKAAD